MNRTVKQQAWIEAMLTGVTPTESARIAGYAESNCKYAGRDNTTNPHLMQEIDRRKAEVVQKTELTIATVLKQLQWGIEQATLKGDLAAAARFSELQGKYLSMWSADGNNAATGLNLNFTTKPRAKTGDKGADMAQDGQKAKTG